MDELYMGREAWRNPDMAISDVRVWLRVLPIGAPEFQIMLKKLAAKEYPNLRNELTDFVIEVCRSNHKNSLEDIKRFLNLLDDQDFTSINLRRLPKKFADFILECRNNRQSC